MDYRTLVVCLAFIFERNKVLSNPIIHINSTDFSKITTASVFVDKTLLIKEILKNNKTAVIQAPLGFGKSSNLNMIKTFLEIEVGADGRLLTAVNTLTEPVRDTKNYKLFVDENMKISKEIDIMDSFLGRTPVIEVTFHRDEVICNLDQAIEFFKETVHKAFKQHSYLLKSNKLGTDQKQYLGTWCDEKDYKMFGKHRVTSGLRELSEYLWRHFDRKVFVLIDDHDSVINSAMFNITDDDVLDDIVRFSVCIMNAVLKSNSRYVMGGLITGVAAVPSFGSSAHNIDDPDSFQIYKFLGNHPFVQYYGLTKAEVDGLLVYPELKLGPSVVAQALAHYNGYTSVDGKEMYNLYSIVRFLENGKIDNYWTKINSIRNLRRVFQVPVINKAVKKLLRNESLNIEVPDDYTVDYIVDLRNVIFSPKTQSTFVTKKFFSFLLEEGYLSYVSITEKNGQEGSIESEDVLKTKTAVKIPNNEIREEFLETVK